MPKTISTTIGPNPTDRRVLQLEQLLNVSRPHAVGVVVMSWAWLHAEQTEGVVPGTPSMLDIVVDMKGAGQALVEAGLVGVSPDGLILPLELRRQADRAARSDESPTDRRRRKDNERKAKSRRNQRLTKPASKPSPSPTAEATVAKRKPRRLGTVEGHDVMLLYSPKTEAWFYCLKDASPKEWTASVADQESPSFAEALAGLHSTMKRETGKGFCSGDTFRPSLQSMVTAAERYRQEREETAAAATRRAEGNKALAEASAVDHDDIDHEPAERDLSRSCPHAEADTVTSPHECPQSGHNAADASPYERQDLDAKTCPHECPQSGHNAAPSSSSSSVFLGNEEKKNTTTTSSVTPHERDHEDGILDRLAPRMDPEQVKQQDRHRLWLERVAAALGTTANAVEYQRRNAIGVLLARMKAAGIDPTTGFPFNAEASSAPAQARDDIGVTTEPNADDKPAAGSAEAPGDDIGFQETSEALDTLGIPRAVNEAPPHDDAEPFEDLRRRTVEQLLEQGA